MNTYNLFISHSWKYNDTYESLVRLLKGRGYFDFKNYSVPRIDPIIGANSHSALYSAIQNQMRPSQVVLILAGVYASYSTWIDAEIRIAKDWKKPIIAIEPWGSERTSKVVKDAANRIVKWNSDSIVKAIRELA
ncbi:TIR domain-containing protein [Escherichia coli]|uniref:TIR domain-containing protein n=1 Tax=Escherichia coli TaxID=562 RepID=UPI0003EDC8DA|nr:TIR domain-containing protein [Escherichia coli]EFA8284819.1 molecular chaperone Tir [Escherichia coli O157]EEW4294481.1 molecular chaperone Tir [Escherichia coli]EEZ5826538.1 molecular chaperone Tir [Escherichia coli]EFG4662710.1 molecular chaperone Tir [Escherichia coli]EFH7028057.1 molecular chaperone Tir [Escherichia coli]